MNEKATHAGTVVSSRNETKVLVAIYETPKFWTDGSRRWRKLDRDGKPDPRPRYSIGDGWYSVTLHVDTIRPLTAQERRSALAQKAKSAAAYVVRLDEELETLQAKRDKAAAEGAKATKAIKAFDRKYPEAATP